MDVLQQLKKLGMLFGRGGGGALGIDIGSSSVKLVELEKKRGKAHLLKYGTLALAPLVDKDTGRVARLPTPRQAEAVTALLEAIGATSRKGTIAIPLRLALIVTLSVPSIAKDKLDTVVPLEARKYIPVSPNEVNIAWSIISEEEEASVSKTKNESDEGSAQIKVLVAAIHNSTIENYQELASAAHINPVLLEIETFSALRSVAGDERRTFALLDIGAEATKTVISDEGSITVSHTINRGSQNITEALAGSFGISFKEAEILKRSKALEDEHEGRRINDIIGGELEAIFNEAKQVLHEFEKSHNRKVERVILIGGGATQKGMLSFAQHILETGVHLGDPFSRVELPIPALKDILKDSGPEFSVAVGLALRSLDEM